MTYSHSSSRGNIRSFTSDSDVKFGSPVSTASTTSSASTWFKDGYASSASDNESTVSSDSDSCVSDCPPLPKLTAASVHPIVAPEQRRNPRRTAAGARGGQSQLPPKLCRQSERKANFVDSLVGTATHLVQAIWPLSSVVSHQDRADHSVLPLATFIQETLRRSRTSYSTLQVALYYLVLVKSSVPATDFTMEQPSITPEQFALQDGRRMFLAALILASKYLQDRNYSAKAWSKISGLNTLEINRNEIAFLKAVDWKIHIADDVFKRWTEVMRKYAPSPFTMSYGGVSGIDAQELRNWNQLIRRLKPDLSNVEPEFEYPTPVSSPEREMTDPHSGLVSPNPCDLTNILNGHDENYLATPTPTSYQVPKVDRPAMVSAMSAATMEANKRFNDCGPGTGRSGAIPPPRRPALRRSSLATSVSYASSPESMVSDSSRTSYSSSISSASTNGAVAETFPATRAAVLTHDQTHFVEPRLWDDNVETGSWTEDKLGSLHTLGDRNAALGAAETLQSLWMQGKGVKRPYHARSPKDQLQREVSDMLSLRRDGGWPTTMVAKEDLNDRKRHCRSAAAGSVLLGRENSLWMHEEV